MHRIQILGGSGAGKTTLGRELAARLGVRFVDLDDLWWLPGWRDVGAAEMKRRLADVAAGDAWVLAGNYGPYTEPLVWPRATMLLVLDLPYRLLLRRAVWRTVRRSLLRETCCNGNRESLLRLFHRDGVVRYLRRTWAPRHARYARLADEPATAHLRVVRLGSPAEVDRFFASMSAGGTLAR